MRKISLLYFSIVLINGVEAQSLRRPVAASYIGLGAYSIDHIDVFSFTANQAALARLKNPAFGVYGEKRFLLSVTNMYSAVLALPTQNGNFGFQADYFGYKNYNESQLGIAYARSVGTKLDLGIKFNYYSFMIPGYQHASTINFEAGAIARLTSKLSAGIHIYNPLGVNFSKMENEKLGSIYKFGIGYEPSEDFLISIEMVKQEDLPVNVNAGVEYDFDKQFFARMGIASENASPYAGAGLHWDNLRVDVSAGYHPQFGISPGLMLVVNLKSKQVDNL